MMKKTFPIFMGGAESGRFAVGETGWFAAFARICQKKPPE